MSAFDSVRPNDLLGGAPLAAHPLQREVGRHSAGPQLWCTHRRSTRSLQVLPKKRSLLLQHGNDLVVLAA